MIGSTFACLDCLMCQPAVPPHRLHQVRPHSKRKRVRDNNIFTIPVNFLLLLHMSYMCHKVDRCLGKTACAPKPIDQPMYHYDTIEFPKSEVTNHHLRNLLITMVITLMIQLMIYLLTYLMIYLTIQPNPLQPLFQHPKPARLEESHPDSLGKRT